MPLPVCALNVLRASRPRACAAVRRRTLATLRIVAVIRQVADVLLRKRTSSPRLRTVLSFCLPGTEIFAVRVPAPAAPPAPLPPTKTACVRVERAPAASPTVSVIARAPAVG